MLLLLLLLLLLLRCWQRTCGCTDAPASHGISQQPRSDGVALLLREVQCQLASLQKGHTQQQQQEQQQQHVICSHPGAHALNE
jgi:hypothetical protein